MVINQEGKPIILKRKRENAAILKAKIKEYTEVCVELLAEFPSCNSSVCTHTGKTYQIENARGYHAIPPNRDSSVKQTYARLTEIGQTIMRTVKCIEEMYDVLRTPGKEVLVTLLSDMDRMKQSEHAHAIPIAYGLFGYSLKVEVIRSMVAEITTACTEQGLKVVAVSSDGQFYKLAVRNKNDEPLTVLQLAKDTWAKAKKLTKSEEIKFLMDVNHLGSCDQVNKAVLTRLDEHGNTHFHGPIQVYGIKDKPWDLLYNPPRLLSLMSEKGNCEKQTEEIATDLDDLPPDVLNKLPDERTSTGTDSVTEEYMESFEMTGVELEIVNDSMSETEDVQMSDATESTIVSEKPKHAIVDYSKLVTALKEADCKRKKAKWSSLTEEILRTILNAQPDTLNSKLSKNELYICGLSFKERIEQTSRTSLDKMMNSTLSMHFHQWLDIQILWL